ncbi:hypothetical protein GCM10010869_37700 [Mesorhizobium tianshanense]|nr:hypothetical protein [Mesorhizobium tianshanense]GLS38176.1 hypothetical protein GCM10010869_37700 [Mesorhizobium tianshanense]
MQAVAIIGCVENQQFIEEVAPMANIVSRLVKECNLTRSKGVDFPTIWQTTLKGHAYVAGPPMQDRNQEGPILKIPLITGRYLIFDASGFRLD